MPVIVPIGQSVKGCGVDYEVVSDSGNSSFDCGDCADHDISETIGHRPVGIFKMTVVRSGNQPSLVWKARRIRRQQEKVVVEMYDAAASDGLTFDKVAKNALPVMPEVVVGGLQLVGNNLGDGIGRHELAVGVSHRGAGG